MGEIIFPHAGQLQKGKVKKHQAGPERLEPIRKMRGEVNLMGNDVKMEIGAAGEYDLRSSPLFTTINTGRATGRKPAKPITDR